MPKQTGLGQPPSAAQAEAVEPRLPASERLQPNRRADVEPMRFLDDSMHASVLAEDSACSLPGHDLEFQRTAMNQTTHPCLLESKQATNNEEHAVNFFLTTTYQQSPVWSIEANGEMAILSQIGVKNYERICIYTGTSREQTAIKQMH